MLNRPLLAIVLTCCMPLMSQASEMAEIKEVAACQAKHQDHKSYSQCLDSVLLKFDRDVTTWENNVEYKLKEISSGSGRGDALMTFNKASRQFHAFREVNCRWQYQARLPDVATAAIEVKECKIYMARDRIAQLTLLSQIEF